MTGRATARGRLAACPACSADIGAGALRCDACGSTLFEPERRVVTVVFADLAGYTRLCSTTDHEDVHLLVRPLMNALRRVFEGLGAVVPTIDGDGCMAVFGARDAQEDDPARAVLAAVQAQRLVEARRGLVGDSLPPLRIGVNLGEALVAPSWESAGFSVTGDTVNVASRLCSTADEGSVLASAAVITAVPGEWWDAARVLEVKNRAQSVTAGELRWEQVPLSSVGQRRLSDTPYAPRPEEEQVLDVLRRGESALVVGEPGLGKSRLLHEVAARVHGAVLRAEARSFVGDGLLSLLSRQALELGRQAGTPVLSRLDERRLRRACGEDVDSTEADTREESLQALAGVVERLAPVTVIADDLQWAPDDELDLLDRWATGHVQVLAASRVAGALSQVTQVALAPLDARAQAGLLSSLLPGLTADVSTKLADRCGGVPLYLEQCVRLLLEEGTLEQTLTGVRVVAPERLSQLPVHMRLFVTSRLDRLDAEDREVLSVAAVIGEHVDVDLLRFLTGLGSDVAAVVERLVERGLLSWAHAPGAPPALAFRHAIVRDVAYETMLRSRRLDIHRAAAEWYAVLPVSALLAEEAAHLDAAISLGGSDCATIRRAVHVLAFFALSVLEEQPRTAGASLDRALELAREHPECEPDLLDVTMARAQLFVGLGDEQAALEEAEALESMARQRESDAHLATALLVRGRALAAGEPDAALQVLAEATEVFSRLGDRAGLARVDIARANCRHESLAPRIAAHESAWSQAQRSADARLVSVAAQDVLMHVPNRDLVESDTWRDRVEASLRPDDLLGQARLRFTDGLLMRLRGDRAGAADALLPVFEDGRQWGSIHLQWNAGLIAAESLALDGRADSAEPVLSALRPWAEARPHRRNVVDLDMHRALVLARSGHGTEAWAMLEAASQEAEAGLGKDLVRQSLAFQVRLGFDAGRWDDVLALVPRVTELDEVLEQSVLGLEVRTLAAAAHVALRRRATLQSVQSLRADLERAAARQLAELATSWWVLDDVLRGYHDALDSLPSTPATAEAHALGLECRAIAGGDAELLLEAAQAWASKGVTAWQARALVWHEALTGTRQERADELLAAVGAPPGLAAFLAAQVAT